MPLHKLRWFEESDKVCGGGRISCLPFDFWMPKTPSYRSFHPSEEAEIMQKLQDKQGQRS